MRFLAIATIVAATAAVAAPLAAQQATPAPPTTALYDQTAPITLEGTADTVEWSSMGGKLVLQPATGTQMWDIVLPDTDTMIKKGVGANQLARGVSVKVRVFKAKDSACAPNCKAQAIDLMLNGSGPTYTLLDAAPAG